MQQTPSPTKDPTGFAARIAAVFKQIFDEDSPRQQHIYFGTLLALSVIWLWLKPLTSSLWLDETLTYWVVKDGLGEMASRLSNVHTFSLYYLMPWAALKLGGTSEIVLRLPSLFAMALAVVVLQCLGERFFDRETGILACLIFVIWPQVAFEASDARPYAVGLLTVVAAVLFLVRWLSTGRLLDGVLYAVLASASVYVHFLFGIMFLVHVAFLVYHRSAAGQVDPKRVCFIALLVALLLTPLTPLFLRLVTRRQLLSFADNPSLRDAVVPSMLLVSLLFGLLFGRVFAKLKFSRESHVRAKNPGFLLLCWMLVPPLLLLAITLLTSTKLFIPRYYLPAVPALSLLCAWGIRMMEPPLARRIIATTLAIVFIGCFMQREKYDDWRRATASARLETEGSSTPVLVRSGLIESTQMDWVLEPEKASYLLAPLAFYPVGGSAFALPYDDSDPVARQYVDQLAQRVLNDSNRFILIARAGSSEAPFKELLETLGRPLGFHAQYVKSFGIIVVVVFEREFKLD